MNSSASVFRKLSGIAWLFVLGCSIGYITRYSLNCEEMLQADVQDMPSQSEYMLAEEQTVESPKFDEQLAAQANAMAEAATMRSRR